jgi:hypothetical protein
MLALVELLLRHANTNRPKGVAIILNTNAQGVSQSGYHSSRSRRDCQLLLEYCYYHYNCYNYPSSSLRDLHQRRSATSGPHVNVRTTCLVGDPHRW